MDAVTADRRIIGEGTSAAAWKADPMLAAVPAIGIDALATPGARAVLVAPHPDDEVLAWGGLLQLLAARGDAGILLVAVSDGEASHPNSAEWPRERLREVRPRETERALGVLGATDVRMVRLGIADGGVAAAQTSLTAQLTALLAPGDLVFTTWRHDGHPDHEACARACAAACAPLGIAVVETPVWGWHWNSPERNAMPFASARKLELSAAQLAGKRAALASFRSQLESDRDTGAYPILPASAIDRLLTPCELYFP